MSKKMLNGKVILITGGTGSFGSSLCKYLLKCIKYLDENSSNTQYLQNFWW